MAIFVIFWKINANMEPENLAKVAAKILEKGPHLEGREILAWYMCPGGRGVAIIEDKSADAGANEFKNWLAYVREMPGFFESYEVLPAVSTLDAVQMVLAKPKK